jgi:hypothetical protein
MASKLRKKFIGDNEVGSSQVLIEKNSAVRGVKQDDSVVDLLKLNSSDEVLLKGIKVLDTSGLIPSAILPSYVDDVLEYANLAAFPATGESGKIYVALDTNKCYRWSGSAYVYITSGAVDSVNGETGVVTLDAGDIFMVSSPATSIESKLVDLQNEIDATQTGAGLEPDGSFLADPGAAYTSGSSSLFGAIGDLDSALNGVEGIVTDLQDDVADLQTLGGAGAGATNLGSFTGSTIADNQSIKSALQDLETAHENHVNDATDAHDASAISVSPAVNGQSNVQGALEDHESRIDSLETALAPTWTRQKFDLNATNISNGYIDLAQNAIGESIHAFVDRLAIHQGEDFTISVVGGVTRITFAGDLVSPGQSQLDANDNIYVRYQYLA